MATSSNARLAPYDIDDESDSMELLNSLREDVKMYRRGCVRFGDTCTGFRLTGSPCCGSTHCTSTNLVPGVFTSDGNCACDDGFISNGDGTDCMPCVRIGAACITGRPNSGCCAGLTCLANKCNNPPPPPIAQGGIGSYCGNLATGKLNLGLLNYGCTEGLLCSSYSYKCSAPLRDAGYDGYPRGCGLLGTTCNSSGGIDMSCCGGGNSICTNGYCACKPGLVPDIDPSNCWPPAPPASRKAIYDFGCDTSGKCRTWCGSGHSWCYTGVTCNRRGITYPASNYLAASAAYSSSLLYPAVAALLPDCNPDHPCSGSCNAY